MKKMWVKEKTVKTVDGERLQTGEVYPSKPKKFKYLIFLGK